MGELYNTKDGVTVHVENGMFSASDGSTYSLSGTILAGSGRVLSRYCQSEQEALRIILDHYGGSVNK